MITGLLDGSYSMFGPAITIPKSAAKTEWPETDPMAHEINPVFEMKEYAPMFNETGGLTTPDRVGQKLSKKI